MDSPFPVDLGRIAQDLQIRRVQVESVVQLLDEGHTVPFIARYRKERTGGLPEPILREIRNRVKRQRDLAERKQTILAAIEAQGKLSDELAEAIKGAENPKRLEDLYLPYKAKKRTRATEAREAGLEPLALRIWNLDETLTDLDAAAAELVNAEKGLDTPEKVLEGVKHILAESISELAVVRDAVRRTLWKTGKLQTVKAENLAEGKGVEFRDYFSYTEPVGHAPPHRVLAINRGEKEQVLKAKLDAPRAELERTILGQLPLEGHPHSAFFTAATLDALDRILLPGLEREIRRDLTEGAEKHATEVFARNLRSLLLQPPTGGQVVLAIDSGQRHGCKVAVLSAEGNLLEHTTIHPRPPQNRRHEAKQVLKDLVARHQVGVVAIGNGPAVREIEELIAELITEGTHFHENPGVPFPGSEAMARAHAEAQAAAAAAAAAAATASPEPAAAEETAPEAPAETPHHNGDGSNHDADADASAAATGSEPAAPVEIPPISGGAPDEEGEVAVPEPSPDATPAEHAPPASSMGETVTSEAEADKADQLASSESTRNPAHEGEPEAPAAETGSATGTPPAEASATPAATTPLTQPPRGPKPPRDKDKDKDRPRRPQGPPPPPKPHAADPLLAKLSYVVVNDAGAKIYSTSPVGREEFPDFDAELRKTISIGRRLLDPLAELVKVEPQSVGVGLYQHDLNPKQLKDTLESVIESSVNFVGVDPNTASASLLQHLAGLNSVVARQIVEHRKAQGPFASREAVKAVEGLDETRYHQVAGFLRIGDAANPLDRAWIHPEQYPVAEKLLEKVGLTPQALTTPESLAELKAKFDALEIPATATELGLAEPALAELMDALVRLGRDPREDLPRPIFKRGVLKLEDLTAGQELKGTVLNVVDFGAFVDIGLKDSGLVHISQLANRYIKSPHDVVSVGDVVNIWVLSVDQDRKRVSLTMVQPGTERPRAERGPRGEGEGQGQGGGGERRGRGGERGGERRGGGGRPPQRREGGPAPAEGQAAAPAAPRPGTNRIPGPPARAQQGGFRGGRPGGAGRGGPGAGRGGFGGGGRGPQGGRPPESSSEPTPTPRKPKPAQPPAPLSKDALTGNAPLRTFGQLKQLFEARTGPDEAAPAPAPETPPATETGGSEG